MITSTRKAWYRVSSIEYRDSDTAVGGGWEGEGEGADKERWPGEGNLQQKALHSQWR
jgi:hypothetical protein